MTTKKISNQKRMNVLFFLLKLKDSAVLKTSIFFFQIISMVYYNNNMK